MTSRLMNGLVSTDAVTAAFSDASLLHAMFQFEAALARAEGMTGLIPDAAAVAISRAAQAPADVDLDVLLGGLRAQATLTIPVVGMLTARVSAADAEAAHYVHWGATSQDVYDTAVVLCLRNAWASIESDHLRLIAALDGLAVRHARTVMLARTLLQPAVPTTFGLKAAGWFGSVARSWHAWSESFDRVQVLQFGGSAGTLAALASHGPAVEQALANELGLEVPDAPWHTHRDRMAAFVASAGVYTGALGKIARDVSLLMQTEVGEVFEPGGGSSTMPQKRNPAGCARVLASAQRLPGLVATMLAAMTQEHERAVGGWHAESSTLVDVVQASASAVTALADLLENLVVDEGRMRQNIAATGGAILAERLTLRLAPTFGRARAAALVKAALEQATGSGRPLAEVVAATPALAGVIGPSERDDFFSAETYLGSAETFRTRLLSAAAAPGARKS